MGGVFEDAYLAIYNEKTRVHGRVHALDVGGGIANEKSAKCEVVSGPFWSPEPRLSSTSGISRQGKKPNIWWPAGASVCRGCGVVITVLIYSSVRTVSGDR